MRVNVNSTSTTDELSDKVTIEGSTPEDTPLHELIRNHYNSFKSMCDQQGKSLAYYVQQEFESYLQYGVLSYGFLRVKCGSCHSELLLGFSCKCTGSSRGQPLEKIGKSFGYVQEEVVLQGKRCLSRNGFGIHANTDVGSYDQ